MAYGPQGITPDYSYQQAMQGRQLPLGQRIGQGIVGGGLAAIQGGLGAYGNWQQVQQQQQLQNQDLQERVNPQLKQNMYLGEATSYGGQRPGESFAQFDQRTKNSSGSKSLPQIGQISQPAAPSENQQLQQLLQHLTSQKIDQMMGRRQMMAPQPETLRQQAFQASNEQMGQQGPPEWQQGQPQFAFDQFTGPGAGYSSLAALADMGTEALGETNPELPWYKQLAHGAGKVAQGAAPLLGMLGPLGLLGGAALGAAGYGLQQI